MKRTTFSTLTAALRRLPALGLLAASSMLTSTAAAQSTCVSPAYGVPGLPGGPQWVSGSPVKTDIDDPRWAGATRIYFPQDLGSGMTESSVRAIRQGNTLSVSFRMRGDGQSDSSDTFWLGVGKGASEADDSTADNDHFLVRISMDGVASGAVATTPTDIEVWERGAEDSSWSAAPTHAWLSEVRAWDDPTSDVVWAINLKVDLSASGIGATGPDGSLFFGSFAEINIADAWVSFWPINSVTVGTATDTNLSESMINPAKWAVMTYGSYSAPCNDGISLTALQIGAAPAPDNLINTPTSSDTTSNDYFAKPDWGGISHSVVNSVSATFQIADWGTTVSDRPNAPWTELATVGNGAAGATSEFHYECPVGTAKCGDIDTSTKDDHQCMLVTLKAGSATPADPLKFARDSVYRNMDFDVASKLERFATVSVQGLEPLPGTTQRDVYLLVKTINMPAPGNDPYFLPLDAMQRAIKVAQHPQRIPPAKRDVDLKKKGAKGQSETEPAPFPLDPDMAHDVLETLASVWPTYEVHAFHDTGRTVTFRGKKYQWLEPQVPFGYFVSHQGELLGFEHALEGTAGVVVTQLSPNLYRLSVPNNGSVKIKSTIEAVESKGSDPCKCKDCCSPPPVQVHIHPRCYCTLPGAGSGENHAAWLFALVICGSLLRRRMRR